MSQPPIHELPANQPPPGSSQPPPAEYVMPGDAGREPLQYLQPTSTPPARSRTVKVILLALGGVLVVCLGTATVGYLALRDRVGAIFDDSKTTLSAPEALGSRPKITDPATQDRADEMVARMAAAMPNTTSTMLAVYGDLSKQDVVLVYGSTATIAEPDKALDSFAAGMKSSGLALIGLAPIEPGPLGGTARCGDANADDVPMGICLWADRGSLGMVIEYFRTAAETAAEFVGIRGAVEKRT